MKITPKSCLRFLLLFALTVLTTFTIFVIPAQANNTAGTLPFSQNWSGTGLITVNDDWSSVPSIIGYRGDGLTAAVGIDPQTLLAGDDAAPVVDVTANQANPNTNTTGGVAEFDGIGNPVVALQGSATADAPYLKIFLNTTGVNNVRVTYNVQDIDGSTDNAIQQVALQYRVGSSGNFTNIPAGYLADATSGPSLATLVTAIDVTLPAAANNQSAVELRIMTTNATGNDEWVGIDDISITANYAPTGFGLSPNSVLENKPAGAVVGTLTAVDTIGDTHTFALVNSASCAGNGADNANFSISGNSLSTTTSFDYETAASYKICAIVTDNNGLSFTGEHIVNITDVADETPPSVSLEQAAGQNDPTNVSPIHFTVVFSEPITGFDGNDVVLSGTAIAATAMVTQTAPNDGTTYNVAVSGMVAGGTVIANINSGAAIDAGGNVNTPSVSFDETVTYSTDISPPHVLFSAKTIPFNNSVLLAAPTQIQIEFDEDIKNDGGAGAANNTANFLLVEAGANTVFDTFSCTGGLLADDAKIPFMATYTNGGSFLATLNFNSLAPGSYRLFICGTTSIEDLLGNKLNNGLSDTLLNFTVSQVTQAASGSNETSDAKLPATGFPIGKLTRLPYQPVDKTYASFSDLWLEIPKLAVSTPIVGVPLSKDGWDVTWLGADAGWLNETAFPTWAGNSVITAHVWDAFNQPGIFYHLKKMGYGDEIKIHAFGQIYVYEVRQTQRITPDNFKAALKHEDKAWLTLLTCEEYRLLFQTYSYRRMVRAVLVRVSPEK